MKSIKFLGAAGMVTGSCYLLTGSDGKQFLIDMGMFQGTRDVVALNYRSLPFDPKNLSAVFLTHAHLDHCGRLPQLVYGGFAGKVYMTQPARALAELVLTDAAQVAKENTTWVPLYTENEVEKLLGMIEVVDDNQEITIGDFSVAFRDAGHILGSVIVEIVDNKATGDIKKVVFSGDLGNYPEDLVRPTYMVSDADVVVMESTYGDKKHPAEDTSEVLKEEINKVESTGGVLLIPAFSLERTQELLHRIHHLKKDNKIGAETPVFLDSPMGIRATLIFEEYKTFYNKELASHTDNPFDFPGLSVTADSRDSRKIIKVAGTKVIIAGSGMMSGGRILHHAEKYLPLNTTRLLFVGYQGDETTGRKILYGAKKVMINDISVQIKATIRNLETMSSHADEPKLLRWLRHIQGVKKVFLTHGEDPQRNALSQRIKTSLGLYNVTLPQMDDEVML